MLLSATTELRERRTVEMTVTLSQAHLGRDLAQNHEALYVLSAVHLERTDPVLLSGGWFWLAKGGE